MKFLNDSKDIDLNVQFEKEEISELFIYVDKDRII
jgi:hypothetical protein